ncbi:hypothetical protein [Undibacter mobilis]|uniref:Uncharacterized protein n=1 Tax=Undibacter mobilis TaxID=2292256 RepID=A0A371BB39_9BRAD|nr:hypothetical protein [Undibacter mobilis]RDV04819.1 hypothetical protein DXH78_09745 [Undibacter mobilis]
MRRSTSPVGPLIAVALLCVAVPVRAEDMDPHGLAQVAASPPAAETTAEPLRGSVDASAWSFLETQAPTIHSEDLPPPVTPVSGLDGEASDKPLSAEESERLGQALLFDPRNADAKARALRVRKAAALKTQSLEVSRTKRADGLSTVIFDKPIAPNTGDWKARVGADLGMMSDTGISTSPDNPLRVQRDARSANAAWASVDVHEIATVDARVSPASEQGMLATTFKRSLPIGSNLSMTLQSRTSMTETYGRGMTTSDIPMMALPASDGTTTPRVWGQDNSAKLNIIATGTTLGAGVSSSSTDTVTHNTLSAEQKLYGPLSVSTAINDVGQTGESRSVRARAKFNW